MQRQVTHLGGSSSVAPMSSSRCIANTGLHSRRLGHNDLDTLKASRDGLIKVRWSNPAHKWVIFRIPLGLHLDLQFLTLQILRGVFSGDDT